jgi:hypothetical protein
MSSEKEMTGGEKMLKKLSVGSFKKCFTFLNLCAKNNSQFQWFFPFARFRPPF